MSSGSGTPQAARRRRVNEQITTTPRRENTETKRDGATAIPFSFLAVYVIIAIGVAAQLFVAFFVLELVKTGAEFDRPDAAAAAWIVRLDRRHHGKTCCRCGTALQQRKSHR